MEIINKLYGIQFIFNIYKYSSALSGLCLIFTIFSFIFFLSNPMIGVTLLFMLSPLIIYSFKLQTRLHLLKCSKLLPEDYLFIKNNNLNKFFSEFSLYIYETPNYQDSLEYRDILFLTGTLQDTSVVNPRYIEAFQKTKKHLPTL